MPFSYLMSFLPLDVLRLLTHCLIPSAFEPQLNQIERRVWVDELPFVQISCHSFSDKESPISANSIKTTKKVPRPLLFNSGNTQQVSRSNWLHKLNTFVYIHLKKKNLCLNSRPFWDQISHVPSHPQPSTSSGVIQVPDWPSWMQKHCALEKARNFRWIMDGQNLNMYEDRWKDDKLISCGKLRSIWIQ